MAAPGDDARSCDPSPDAAPRSTGARLTATTLKQASACRPCSLRPASDQIAAHQVRHDRVIGRARRVEIRCDTHDAVEIPLELERERQTHPCVAWRRLAGASCVKQMLRGFQVGPRIMLSNRYRTPSTSSTAWRNGASRQAHYVLPDDDDAFRFLDAHIEGFVMESQIVARRFERPCAASVVPARQNRAARGLRSAGFRPTAARSPRSPRPAPMPPASVPPPPRESWCRGPVTPTGRSRHPSTADTAPGRPIERPPHSW